LVADNDIICICEYVGPLVAHAEPKSKKAHAKVGLMNRFPPIIPKSPAKLESRNGTMPMLFVIGERF
ncbi:MAG TPA: hypothetical protein VEU95_06035, partial [Micropepsaceae bacterium]|nr:hypothetical protein [Micropepsaceae bacterium]